jgi:hypothetical protein
MNYPCISACSQCGKLMAQFRPSKKFCSGKCKVKAHRIKHNLPLTWKPDPTKRKVMIGDSHTPDLFRIEMIETEKGLRKVLINRKTGDLTVFAIQDGKEVLIR